MIMSVRYSCVIEHVDIMMKIFFYNILCNSIFSSLFVQIPSWMQDAFNIHFIRSFKTIPLKMTLETKSKFK